jgi:hypothetical protein
MSNIIDFTEHRLSLQTRVPSPHEFTQTILHHLPHGIDHITAERCIRQHRAKCANADENSWMDIAYCYTGAPCYLQYEGEVTERTASPQMPIMLPVMISEATGITIPISIPVHRLVEEFEIEAPTIYAYIDKDDATIADLLHVDTARLVQADDSLTNELKSRCLSEEVRDVMEECEVDDVGVFVRDQVSYWLELEELVAGRLRGSRASL